jgi:acid phosphatase class B
MISKLINHHKDGDKCIIVTARDPEHEKDEWIQKNEPKRTKVIDFVKKHNLPISKIIFTNHKPKGPILKSHNVYMHFDDKDEEIDSANNNGIKTIKVEKK